MTCFSVSLFKVSDATHEGLYQLIVEFFTTHEIPYKQNLIGFAADGANVMFGRYNSVSSKLKEDIPHLHTMKCICHSLALCVSHAVEKLPSSIEELLSEVYCYIRYSSKRNEALNYYQKLFDIPEHKLLKLIKLRWSSLRGVVSRFLEQYDPLVAFFEKESQSNREEPKIILKKLKSHFNLLYLQFLDYILPIVCDRNTEFQSEKPKIFTIYKKMEMMFKTILTNYLRESYVESTDVQYIAYKDPSNFEDIEKIDLGPRVNAELRYLKCAPELKRQFRLNCLNFYVELADRIYSKFPFNDSSVMMLRDLCFIDPLYLKEVRSISTVSKALGKDVVVVDEEYKRFRLHFKDETTTDIFQFWNKVRNTTKGDGELLYPNVLDVVDSVNILPHTSAKCERIFSDINCNKTKFRNSLQTDTLTGVLHGKVLLHTSACYNYKCSDEILKLMNTSMYDLKK